jgi:hypothetical protein
MRFFTDFTMCGLVLRCVNKANVVEQTHLFDSQHIKKISSALANRRRAECALNLAIFNALATT